MSFIAPNIFPDLIASAVRRVAVELVPVSIAPMVAGVLVNTADLVAMIERHEQDRGPARWPRPNNN